MPLIHDYIVVGSGATGAQAAQTLIESGAKVTMLDVGIKDDKYKRLVPNDDFIALREKDLNQHRYFVGDNLEGMPWGSVKVGAQLTPPRQFITRGTEQLIPLVSENFQPMESLAYGGLGSGWGLGCFVFSRPELEKIGLDRSRMKNAYEVVSKRIGISAVRDDAAPYGLGDLGNFQEGLTIDKNCLTLYKTYCAKRTVLNSKGFFMGQPPMAILSQDMGKRKKISYKDMEFYTDHEMSAYRPWMTVDELRTDPQFLYCPNCLVLSFEENEDHINVLVYRTDVGEKDAFKCRRLVLASGVLGTARIVLRSFKKESRLPMICNHYCYMPCIQPAMLGKPIERFKTSVAQLVLFHDENRTHTDVAAASLFSYRSLLLFRLIKEAPLNFADGRKIMQALQSSLVIAGVHHPDSASPTKYVELVEDRSTITQDKLHAHYSLSSDEADRIKKRERKYMSALRTLLCFPIKRIYPGFGSSIHYAGTLPFNNEEVPYTLSPNGRLHGTKNVFIADGSGFRYLPAKGPTFSLMANAHLVAQNALSS